MSYLKLYGCCDNARRYPKTSTLYIATRYRCGLHIPIVLLIYATVGRWQTYVSGFMREAYLTMSQIKMSGLSLFFGYVRSCLLVRVAQSPKINQCFSSLPSILEQTHALLINPSTGISSRVVVQPQIFANSFGQAISVSLVSPRRSEIQLDTWPLQRAWDGILSIISQ